MQTFEFDPAPALAGHVARYFGMAAPADVRPGLPYQLPPEAGIALLSQRSAKGAVRGSLVGPRTEPLIIQIGPGDRLWGVRFWPDAGGLVLGKDPRDLVGHFVSPLAGPQWAIELLESLAACRDRRIAARTADDLLLPRVRSAPEPDPVARRAVQALIATHGDLGIAELAGGVGLSLRQLERRFGAATGLNPMQFARLRKMRGDVGGLFGQSPTTWREVAGALEQVRP